MVLRRLQRQTREFARVETPDTRGRFLTRRKPRARRQPGDHDRQGLRPVRVVRRRGNGKRDRLVLDAARVGQRQDRRIGDGHHLDSQNPGRRGARPVRLLGNRLHRELEAPAVARRGPQGQAGQVVGSEPPLAGVRRSARREARALRQTRDQDRQGLGLVPARQCGANRKRDRFVLQAARVLKRQHRRIGHGNHLDGENLARRRARPVGLLCDRVYPKLQAPAVTLRKPQGQAGQIVRAQPPGPLGRHFARREARARRQPRDQDRQGLGTVPVRQRGADRKRDGLVLQAAGALHRQYRYIGHGSHLDRDDPGRRRPLAVHLLGGCLDAEFQIAAEIGRGLQGQTGQVVRVEPPGPLAQLRARRETHALRQPRKHDRQGLRAVPVAQRSTDRQRDRLVLRPARVL